MFIPFFSFFPFFLLPFPPSLFFFLSFFLLSFLPSFHSFFLQNNCQCASGLCSSDGISLSLSLSLYGVIQFSFLIQKCVPPWKSLTTPVKNRMTVFPPNFATMGNVPSLWLVEKKKKKKKKKRRKDKTKKGKEKKNWILSHPKPQTSGESCTGFKKSLEEGVSRVCQPGLWSI